jgi:hypothetical protein
MSTTEAEALEHNAEPVPPSDRDYQAYWTTAGGNDWVGRVLAEVRSWSADKLGVDIDTTVDGETTGKTSARRVEVLHRSAGREAGVRVRAWNTNHGTTFVVTILAVDGPDGGWLTIRTTSSDHARRAEKPKVADMILDVVDLSDVGPVRTGVRHVSIAALDELGELVGDQRRRLPVLVAAPVDGVEFGRWMQAVRRWTRRCAGIAHVVSLDPNSADQFRAEHGRRAVLPGTLRTYPPGVDLDDPATEATARWLSTRTLVGPDGGVARIVERFVRQYQGPLPAAVRDWTRAFERIAAQRLRSAVEPDRAPLTERVAARQAARPTSPEPLAAELQTPPVPAVSGDEVSTDLAEELRAELAVARAAHDETLQQLAYVQEYLGLPDLAEPTLLDLLDAATRTQPDEEAVQRLLTDNDDLRTQVESLEDALELERLDAAELALERDRLDAQFAAKNREAAFLRSKVVEHDPAVAYSWVDDEGPVNPLGECPPDWDALLSDPRLALHKLIITGNPRTVKAVKPLDLDFTGLHAAWDALGTMAAYRAARLEGAWGIGLHAFCESGPADRFHVPPNKHARDETSGTRARFADHRLLPVPTEVDPTGHVQMWAHFKPHSWSAQQKLRIHYYDQVTTDGFIYIGHIGEHLPSGSTDKVRR